jgi:peroxiredoxin
LCDYNRKVIEVYGIVDEDFFGLEDYTAAKQSFFILDREGVVRYK